MWLQKVRVSCADHCGRPFLYPRFSYAQRKVENELKLMEDGEAGPIMNGDKGTTA